MLEDINKHWGWTGLRAAKIMAHNAFGNFLVRNHDHSYWRICPEELSCAPVARNAKEYARLTELEDFQTDWQVAGMVALARRHLGPLNADQSYYLVTPGVLGGAYHASNLQKISLRELISLSGDLALSIKDLPDGATIKLDVTD